MEIKIEHYTKIIAKRKVLNDININLCGGKIYGLVGTNGSGKTMLMRAICGLILPTKGKVVFNDKVIGKDVFFAESTGVLIENPSFIPNYSGFMNLKYIANLNKVIDDRDIVDILTDVGLDALDKLPYRKYSLGMKQKLGIAAAIMEKPKLIILDEPFNAIDEESVNRIIKIIMELKSDDRIIIISCHDSTKIEMLCDENINISNGIITM